MTSTPPSVPADWRPCGDEDERDLWRLRHHSLNPDHEFGIIFDGYFGVRSRPENPFVRDDWTRQVADYQRLYRRCARRRHALPRRVAGGVGDWLKGVFW